MKGHGRGPSPSSRLLSRTASSSSRLLDLPTLSETHGDNVSGSKVLGGFHDAKLPGGTDKNFSAVLRKGRTLSNRELPTSASHPLPGQGPQRSSRVAQELMMTTGRRRGSSGAETSRTISAQADGGEVGNEDWETRVWVWGCSANGQCVEDEGLLCLSSPRWLRSLETAGLAIKALACGRTVSVALTEMGQVWSWGTGPVLGREAGTRGPGLLDGLAADVVDVAVGEEHALACTRQGELYAWGLGAGGKLGTGDTNNRLLPVHVTAAPLHQVVILRVACGQRHSAVLCADGGLFTFGAGRAGQLGHGNFKDQRRPKKVGFFEGGDGVMAVSCGTNHTAAFTKSGQLYCWGWGEHGRLGLGDEESRSLPSLVGGALENRHVTGVSCGAAHTVATTQEGIVYAFGWNEYGQVRRKHALVPPPASSCASSSHHDLGVLHPVRVLESFLPPPCFDPCSNNKERSRNKERLHPHDSEGQSDGDEDEYEDDYENSGQESGRGTDRTDGEARAEAVKPSSRGSLGQQEEGKEEEEVAGNRVVKISAGFAHSAALTADGRLFLWGFGEEGQLGTGDEVSLGLPVELTSLPDGVSVVDVALGHCHSTALVSRLSRRALEVRWAKATKREQAAKALCRFLRVCLLRGRVRMLARVVAGERKSTASVTCGRKGKLVNLEEEEDQEQDTRDKEAGDKEVEPVAHAEEEAEGKETSESQATAEVSGEDEEEDEKEEASEELIGVDGPTEGCEALVGDKAGEGKAPEDEEEEKQAGGEGEEEEAEYDDDFADDEEEERGKKKGGEKSAPEGGEVGSQEGRGEERAGVDAEEEGARGVAVVVALEAQDASMTPGDDKTAAKAEDAVEVAAGPGVQDEHHGPAPVETCAVGQGEKEDEGQEHVSSMGQAEATPRGEDEDEAEELVIPPNREAAEVAALPLEATALTTPDGAPNGPLAAPTTKLAEGGGQGEDVDAPSTPLASTSLLSSSPTSVPVLPTPLQPEADMPERDHGHTPDGPIQEREGVVKFKAVEPTQQAETGNVPEPMSQPPPPSSLSLQVAPPAPPAAALELQQPDTGKATATATQPGPSAVKKRVSRIPKPSKRLWPDRGDRRPEPFTSAKATVAPQGAVAVKASTHSEADGASEMASVSKPAAAGRGRRSKSPPHYDRPWRRGPRTDKAVGANKADGDSGDEHHQQATGHKAGSTPAQRPWGGGSGKAQATSVARQGQVGPGSQRRAMNRPLGVGKRQAARPHVAVAVAVAAAQGAEVEASTPGTEPRVSSAGAAAALLPVAGEAAVVVDNSQGPPEEGAKSGPPEGGEGAQAHRGPPASPLPPGVGPSSQAGVEATAECEEPVASRGLSSTVSASEAEAQAAGVPTSPVVMPTTAAVQASDIAPPCTGEVEPPLPAGKVEEGLSVETGGAEAEDVPPTAMQAPRTPVTEPFVTAAAPGTAHEKEGLIGRTVVGNNQAEDAYGEAPPVKAEASVGGGGSVTSHDASSTTPSTSAAGQEGRVRLSRALPVWGQHRPNTAAKTRGLRLQLQTGHKLQQNWLRRSSRSKEAVREEEADEEGPTGSAERRAEEAQEGASTAETQRESSSGRSAAEGRQERQAARVQRAEVRRAAAKARREQEEATRKPFPFLRRRSQSLADLPRVSGGLKADGTRQHPTKGSQPSDYKYFKDRYCSETDTKASQSSGRRSSASQCSSPASRSKDEEVVESHASSGESDAGLSKGKGKSRGGKGPTRKVSRGHRRAASEGTMPVVEGGESEEDRARRRSVEPIIQRRSVLKMHRRLGLVQQRSAICLPRSAAASSQDGEPSGLDGPRRDVRRPYLQGTNTSGQDVKVQAQAAPPMEFENLFHPAIEGMEGGAEEERPEVAEADDYAEEDSHFLPSVHSVRSL